MYQKMWTWNNLVYFMQAGLKVLFPRSDLEARGGIWVWRKKKEEPGERRKKNPEKEERRIWRKKKEESGSNRWPFLEDVSVQPRWEEYLRRFIWPWYSAWYQRRSKSGRFCSRISHWEQLHTSRSSDSFLLNTGRFDIVFLCQQIMETSGSKWYNVES